MCTIGVPDGHCIATTPPQPQITTVQAVNELRAFHEGRGSTTTASGGCRQRAPWDYTRQEEGAATTYPEADCTPQLQATDQPKNPEPGGVIVRSKTEHGVPVMKMKRQRTQEGKGREGRVVQAGRSCMIAGLPAAGTAS